MWSEGEVGSFSKHRFCLSFRAQAFPRQVLDIQLKELGKILAKHANYIKHWFVIYTQLPRNDRPDLDGAVLQCYQ